MTTLDLLAECNFKLKETEEELRQTKLELEVALDTAKKLNKLKPIQDAITKAKNEYFKSHLQINK